MQILRRRSRTGENMRILAERGVGGEKETALRMYEELCRKYDISEDHMMESRSQRIPRMVLRGVRLRGVVRRS